MTVLRRVLLACVAVLLGGAAGFAALAWHPSQELMAATTPPPDPALVARGAQLAAIGDCATCHTAPAGRPYAGGYRLHTPFGAMYTPNITADRDTGIGGWSLASFTRAMRRGISRDGHNLYPALPYDHFTRLSDDDIRALHAFLAAVEPVRATAPANELRFPFNMRPLLAGWNLLFLRDRRFQPDGAHDAQWNRGAYLVEGLGHCGACHTARNALGAEKAGEALRGGEAEGWQAWPIIGTGWSEDSIYNYLRTGQDRLHGAAAGPMAPVSWNLGRVPEADVRAMAVYLASLAGPPHPAQAEDPAAGAGTPGAVLFAGACNSCHGPASPMHAAGAPYLNTSSSVMADDAGNVVRVILRGIPPNPGRAGPQMPPYANVLDDGQVAAVASYLRARYAPGRPAWSGLPDAVAQIRREGKGP